MKKITPKQTLVILPLLLGGYSSLTFAEPGEGQFVKDTKTGCKIYDLEEGNHSASWSGACVDGKISGNGTLTIVSKNPNATCESKVEMKEGLRTGRSVTQCSDGVRVEGEYKPVAGVANGIGTVNFPNGDKYVGEMKGQTLHGQGTYTTASGKSMQGIFANNKPVQIITDKAPSINDPFTESLALFKKGMALYMDDLHFESIATLEKFLVKFKGSSTEISDTFISQRILAKVINTQAIMLFQNGFMNKAIAKWDENNRLFANSTDPDIKKILEENKKEQAQAIANLKDSSKIYFEEVFDPEQARNAISAGNATIKGRACFFYGGRIYTKSGAEIYLTPVTPHSMEIRKIGYADHMRKYIKSTDEYSITIRKTKIYGDGYYVFSNIKPGKYYITTTVDSSVQHKRTDYVYSIVNNNGRTDYYTHDYYWEPIGGTIEELVEVTEDAEIKTVNLYRNSLLNRIVNIDCR